MSDSEYQLEVFAAFDRALLRLGVEPLLENPDFVEIPMKYEWQGRDFELRKDGAAPLRFSLRPNEFSIAVGLCGEFSIEDQTSTYPTDRGILDMLTYAYLIQVRKRSVAVTTVDPHGNQSTARWYGGWKDVPQSEQTYAPAYALPVQ